MAQQAAVAHAAAGIGLAGEGKGGGTGPADLPGQQMQVMDYVVRPDPPGPLVQAHAPETHGRLGGRKPTRRLDDLRRRASGDLLRRLRGVVIEELHIVVPGHLGNLGRRPRIDHGFEDRVLVDKFLVVEIFLDDHMGHGVQNRQVGAGGEAHVQVGDPGRQGLARVGHDDLHVLALLLPLVHQPEDDRMGLGHIGADDEKAVGMVDVVVGPHGLVLAEGRDIADRGGGHAQSGVAVDIVGAQPPLEQLVDEVAFLGIRLARAVEGHRIGTVLADGIMEFVDHDPHGLVPGDPDEFVAAAQQGILQTIGGVEDGGEKVALEAEEPLVPVVLVALHRHDFAALHPGVNAAAGTAVTTDTLHPFVRLPGRRQYALGQGQIKADSRSGGQGCRIFHQFSSCHLHGYLPPCA